MGFQKLQEILDKQEYKDTLQHFKEQREKGIYDHHESNILGLGSEQRLYKLNALKEADAHEISETLKSMRLAEFLAKSGTTGIAGAAYLVPTKIYQELFSCAAQADICADVSFAMIPAEQIPGTTMTVDIVKDGSYKPDRFRGGSVMYTETMETVQATLDFSESFGINFRITNDLIEDSQFELVARHIEEAGKAMGEKATDAALTVLKTATDGDGTVNGGASGDANETKFTGATTTDLVDLHQQILDDKFVPNKLVLVPHTIGHSIATTAYISSSTYSEPWAYNLITEGLPKRILGCDVIYSNVDTLTNSGVMDNLVSIMLDSRYAMITGRKRWLRIENYSEPIRDLVGATISSRQDSVTVFNDSIGVITET